MLEEKEIESIRKNANIIDIISGYLPLTQKGKNYFGVCPFHDDKNPSMSVSEEKQIYKCFSCGAAGNVFTFVKDYENVSFFEAVKIVAEKCGLVFKGEVKTKAKIKNNKTEYEIMDLALKFYQNNINSKEGIKAKKYLSDRSLNEDAIKDFDIGLALGGEYSLNKFLINKNYNIDSILDLGLINRKGDYINDVFNNRIMFPIHNLDGDVIGFTGRIYDNSDQAKYINSKESVIFKKGQILFNYHRAKNEIKKKREVIIVEGNMDAIRLYSSGVKNVVALMGTSLTREQVVIIKQLRAKVILMLDNDEAGDIATFQNGNILSNAGIQPLVVRLSGEKDPDEYIIKNGVEAIIDNIKNSINFLDFKLKYLKKNKDLNKTEDLVSYIKDIILNIKDIDDELTKEITIKKMAEEYNIPIDLLKNELAKSTKNKTIDTKVLNEKKLAKSSFSKYDIACQNIIYFMMNDYLYIERFKKELGFVSKREYRNVINEIIYYYEKNKSISLSEFITFISDKEYIYDEAMEIIRSVNIENLNMDNFMEFVCVAIKEEKKEKIKELKGLIARELDSNKKLELANKLIELKKGCVGNEK